ncbi:uncharacterized protein sb:cb288 isoform X1 [Brienomyrus brachyistius]|uniref:uncharacterized protein sb:cb288 isoform X1 n=1 Tax=Brienomyrus brachyistius TaxID=42636 RepID=UPI0020B40091|nr:uncharacterized protein sb:cb288 isoform X1 [Brienomyrus brachyistius]
MDCGGLPRALRRIGAAQRCGSGDEARSAAGQHEHAGGGEEQERRFFGAGGVPTITWRPPLCSAWQWFLGNSGPFSNCTPSGRGKRHHPWCLITQKLELLLKVGLPRRCSSASCWPSMQCCGSAWGPLPERKRRER